MIQRVRIESFPPAADQHGYPKFHMIHASLHPDLPIAVDQSRMQWVSVVHARSIT